MDVAVLAVSADKDFNNFGMLAARDYWFDSWLRRKAVNTVMNLIPVDRKSNNKKLSVEDSQALCNAFMSYGNRSLILFPEGTRGKAGEILPFKNGGSTIFNWLRQANRTCGHLWIPQNMASW